MKSHIPDLEVFLRNSFSLVNLGAWEPKTDTVVIDMNSIDKYSQKTGIASEELHIFTLRHELINRLLQCTIPLTTLMLINRENISFVTDLDHYLKTHDERSIKDILMLNSVIIQRLFIESEPLVEAYYMLEMATGENNSLFEALEDELLAAYPKAMHIYQRMRNIGNNFVIIDALNNPRLCHEYIWLVNSNLPVKRLPRDKLASLWPEIERPYERCMCLIDAIEAIRKQKNETGASLTKSEMFEDINRAKRLTRIESSFVDLTQLPPVIKSVISSKLYLKPKSSPESKIRDMQSSLLIELRDNQLKLVTPFRKPKYASLFMNLALTWIVHQILAEDSEIGCFFEKFKLCSTRKRQCSTCGMGKYIGNGMRLSEIFRSIETEMDYFWKVYDRQPEDY